MDRRFGQDCPTLPLKSGDALDRSRIQQHISGIETRLRRRLRSKLRRVDRSAYDTDDVLSSTRRRVDTAVRNGRLVLRSESELDAYIERVMERVALDVIRRERRQGRLRSALAGVIQPGVQRGGLREERWPDLARVISGLDEAERTALELAARGLSQSQIASLTGSSAEAQRSRWRRLVARVRALDIGVGPGRGPKAESREVRSR